MLSGTTNTGYTASTESRRHEPAHANTSGLQREIARLEAQATQLRHQLSMKERGSSNLHSLQVREQELRIAQAHQVIAQAREDEILAAEQRAMSFYEGSPLVSASIRRSDAQTDEFTTSTALLRNIARHSTTSMEPFFRRNPAHVRRVQFEDTYDPNDSCGYQAESSVVRDRIPSDSLAACSERRVTPHGLSGTGRIPFSETSNSDVARTTDPDLPHAFDGRGGHREMSDTLRTTDPRLSGISGGRHTVYPASDGSRGPLMSTFTSHDRYRQDPASLESILFGTRASAQRIDDWHGYARQPPHSR